jgi:chitodextrinase
MKTIILRLFVLLSAVVAVSSTYANVECSSMPIWNAQTVYWGGNFVIRADNAYRAAWWTQGQDPLTHSGQWEVWRNLGPCTTAHAPTVPHVDLTNPTEGETVWALDTLKISAAATDEDGTVAKVVFMVGGSVVGEDAIAPYQMDWLAATSGNYTAAAIALDDQGLQSAPSSAAFIVAERPAELPKRSRIVGYFPSYRGGEQNVQFDKLTEIVYAFVLPNPDGSLQPVPGSDKLERLRAAAAKYKVRVGVALGGWNDGNDTAFESLAASPTSRAIFVKAVTALAERYALDFIDLDWEYPDLGASKTNFEALVAELSTALRAQGRTLSIAVAALGTHADAIPDSIFDNVDFLNIMAYDSGEISHSSYAYAERSLGYWLGRGLPRSKAILGVPFYSRPNPQSYADLIQNDPANACRDTNGETYWNGIPTIRKKAQLALDSAGGIMNWELGQDTRTSESLLTSEWEILTGKLPSFSCVTTTTAVNCTTYGGNIPSYPNWPRVDWQGLPDHAIAGDLMRYRDSVFMARWWTQTVPGSDDSWEQKCP